MRYWNLCQPLAIVALGAHHRLAAGTLRLAEMIILEGALPFIWLPIWWFCIRDHPREAKWISTEERHFLETTLKREVAELEPPEASAIIGDGFSTHDTFGHDRDLFPAQLRRVRLHDFLYHG